MVAHALDLSDAVLAVVRRRGDTDAVLIVEQVNAAYCRALGVDFKALEGRPLASAAAPGQSDKIAALAAAAARQEAHRTELICVRPNGSQLWLGLTLMPASLPIYGDNLFVMLARDITKQRQDADQQNAIQRLLATAFSVAEAGLAIVGKDGRFLITNAFHDRLLGYEPGGLKGKPTIECLATESRDQLELARARQFNDRNRYELEVVMIRADGKHLPVKMVSAIVDSQNDNEPLRVVTITQRGPAITAPRPVPKTAPAPEQTEQTQLVGKVRLTSFDDMESDVGDRGGSVERLMEMAERIVARQMQTGDSYFRTKDHGFAITFGNASEEKATFRSAAIARDIRQQLIHAGEDPTTVEVSAVVAPLSQIAEGAQRNAGIERQIADLEPEMHADVDLPAGAEGFMLEPIIGKERGPVLGYFARAVWPPQQRGRGRVATLAVGRFNADIAALGFAEKVALERIGGSNEALFLELDFDCFFDREKTQMVIDACQRLSPAVRKRIVLLLSGISEKVAQTRVLDSVQRLRPFCRAVGFVIDNPDLPVTEATAIANTFVLLNAHVWDRSKAVGNARIAKLATGLNARKSALILRGVPTPAAREALRDNGIKLFAVARQ